MDHVKHAGYPAFGETPRKPLFLVSDKNKLFVMYAIGRLRFSGGGDALITSDPEKNCCGKWDLMIACSRHLLPSAFGNISCSFLRATASVKHGRIPAQVFGVFFGVPEWVDDGARICQGSASRSKKHVRVQWGRGQSTSASQARKATSGQGFERRMVLLVFRCVAAH